MNLLVDIQDDGDLSYAMHFLFEKRLGYSLYWMTGNDWVTKGYFNPNWVSGGSHLICRNDGFRKKWNWKYKTITLSDFIEKKNDFIGVISLVTLNDNEYHARLVSEVAPHMKRIRHLGNIADCVNKNSTHNVISSLTLSDESIIGFTEFIINEKRNHVFAHQEFDKNIFKYLPVKNNRNITGFQHDLNCIYYKPLWNSIKNILHDFDWKFHGHGGEDGNISCGKKLGDAFINTGFVLQLKNAESCGGHLTYNAFATGRPLICKRSFYNGIMREMLIDGKTCIDLDSRNSDEENSEYIRYCSDINIINNMSKNMYETFLEYCDYEKESKDVRKFMSNLI